MMRWWIGLVLVAGCGEVGNVKEAGAETPAAPVVAERPSAPCEPVVHETQGKTADPSITEYRLEGASADMRKLAVFFSEGGVAGRERLHRYVVYTAGRRDAVSAAYPMRDAPKEVWEEFKDPDVHEQFIPDAVAWCRTDGQVWMGDGAEPWTWELVEEGCGREGEHTLNWRLCPPGGGPCAQAPDLPEGWCWTEPPGLVDLYRRGDVLWVVAERERELHTARMIGGVVAP
jgi:hypothetical protein